MKIPAAFILLSSDKEALLTLFKKTGNTPKDLFNVASNNKNLLLFSNKGSANLISFEHSFGYGDGPVFTISFIDPKNEFETNFFSDSLVKNIAGFTQPEGIKYSTENGVVVREKVITKQSISKLGKAGQAEFKKNYLESFGEKEIYIVYGVGQNFDTWSGPHRTIISGANVEVKGPKKITLKLIASSKSLIINQNRGAENEIVNLNLGGLTQVASGHSRPINFKNALNNSKPIYNPVVNYPEKQSVVGFNIYQDIKKYDENFVKFLKELELPDLANLINNIDVHSIVVDTIRSYIQNVTQTPNVIVLLPNLNLLSRKYLNDQTSTSKINTNKPAKSINLGSTAKSEEFHPKKIAALSSYNSFLISVLDSFNLKLKKIKKEDETNQPTIPFGLVGLKKNIEKFKEFSERFNSFFTDNEFRSTLDSIDSFGFFDHQKTLNNVISSIREKITSNYPLEVIYISETNEFVKKLWSSSDYKNQLLFGGYDTFNNYNDVVIFGDKTLIREYLYGGININKKEDSIYEFKQKAKTALTQKNINFLNDDFIKTQVGLQNTSDATLQNNQFSKEEYLLAVEQAVPLHPVDKAVLFNKNYNFKIRDLLYSKKENLIGSFGDPSYIPDKFAYRDEQFTEQEIEYIQKEQIPVFRYNTKNPNILKLKFNFAPIYLNFLKTGFRKEVERKSSAVAEGIMSDGFANFETTTEGAAIGFLVNLNYSKGLGDSEKNEIIQTLAAKLSKELITKVKGENNINAAKKYANLVDQFSEENYKSYLQIKQALPGNPESIIAELGNKLYREALRLNIQTLPMFHLSKTSGSVLDRPCLVFAQDVDISQSIKPPRSILNSFFSGLYNIIGYKHKITTSDISSEFSLVKVNTES